MVSTHSPSLAGASALVSTGVIPSGAPEAPPSGAAVDSAAGSSVASAVGSAAGSSVASAVGSAAGSSVASAVGSAAGSSVASAVGSAAGSSVGAAVDSAAGCAHAVRTRQRASASAASVKNDLFMMLPPSRGELAVPHLHSIACRRINARYNPANPCSLRIFYTTGGAAAHPPRLLRRFVSGQAAGASCAACSSMPSTSHSSVPL